MQVDMGDPEGPQLDRSVCPRWGDLQGEDRGGWGYYQREDRSTSGARYQRVATYSVRAWFLGPSGKLLMERARPKSQSFTKQLASRRTLDGW